MPSTAIAVAAFDRAGFFLLFYVFFTPPTAMGVGPAFVFFIADRAFFFPPTLTLADFFALRRFGVAFAASLIMASRDWSSMAAMASIGRERRRRAKE